MDRLNREFDQKKSRMLEGDDVIQSFDVPVEAKCKAVKKKLDGLRTENEHFQKRWITAQTEMLQIQTDSDGSVLFVFLFQIWNLLNCSNLQLPLNSSCCFC